MARTTRREIEDGPGELELFFALSRRGPIRFNLSWGGDVKVRVWSVEVVDGSPDGYVLRGIAGQQKFTASYNVRSRRGWFERDRAETR